MGIGTSSWRQRIVGLHASLILVLFLLAAFPVFSQSREAFRPDRMDTVLCSVA